MRLMVKSNFSTVEVLLSPSSYNITIPKNNFDYKQLQIKHYTVYLLEMSSYPMFLLAKFFKTWRCSTG